MSAKNVLVTGANGFIGTHLVNRLIARGDNVSCLVRRTSNISTLKNKNCSIIYADTTKDRDEVAAAIIGKDAVYHLAASTNAVRSSDLIQTNTQSMENVLHGCDSCHSPPTLVFVSSLAAVGPSLETPHLESDPRKPVSNYGRSKAACEIAAEAYASRIPISIVRPPIVLGQRDRYGLEMFRTIDRWGCHFVTGFRDHDFSVIHVDDLATALISVAEAGHRLSPESESEGIYFASANEMMTYAELGRRVGQALGRDHTRILRVSKPLVWLVGGINELKGRITSKPQFLNLDKYREATAGSWVCSNTKIKEEVGVCVTTSMLERLKQTAQWYRTHGWLKKRNLHTRPKSLIVHQRIDRTNSRITIA